MIDISLLVNICKIKDYEKGDIVISELDKNQDEMFILLIGSVKTYKNYRTPHEISMGTVSKGNIFGEMNLFNSQGNVLTVVAEENIKVASITRRDFKNLAKKNLDVVLQIMEMLCEKISNKNSEIAILNVEKNRIVNEYGINEKELNKRLLFPEAHSKYEFLRPKESDELLYDDKFICPNCGEVFDGKTPFSPKLVLKGEISCDMRRVYKNYDPIWYDALTCPHCLFSALTNMFNPTEPKPKKKNFEDMLGLIKENFEFEFKEPKDINQVFSTYYLGLICAEGYDNAVQLKAKIWLYLSWIYKDLEDDVMERYATEKAYDLMSQYFSETKLTDEATQITLMIMGTLARRLGNYNDAILHLSNAIRAYSGNAVYKRLIENEVYDIKEER